MKILNEITVKVTYEVTLGGLEVPSDIFEKLEEIYDRGGDVNMSKLERNSPEVLEFLNENFKEDDACDWSYTIDEIDYD
ncbi:hypothetical protein [Empedobacter falsenii]|uniref:Uncharacterized protein n=1 Tax=Empedobacter falsenii TaxID=343874 RepID=A0AAW7DLJ2_9FLAO|nr:hypothetical protein [Empedobacter falsenii]MDM1551535.1 hypothetical protein [Empedobacter falsenii]